MKSGLLALLSSVLLLWVSVLAQETSTGEEAVLKQAVTKDIRDNISDRDLEAVRVVLEAHFIEPLQEGLELHGAMDINGMRVLHVGFDFPVDRFGENTKCIVTVGSESEGNLWKLDEITIHSELTLPGHDDPISVVGAVEPNTVAELIEHVSEFWSTSDAGQMKISAVTSNALPPLLAPPELLQGAVPDVIYNVHVRSLEPVKPHIHQGSESANLVIASMSSDSVFSVWLKRGDRGQLVTTDVHPTSIPGDDPDRLAALREHIEERSDASAAQQRIDAARAVVPETARGVEFEGTMMMLQGQMELFIGQLPKMQVSDRREASGNVDCARVAGTDAPWRCSYHATSATQRVSGQKSPIMLHVDADEGLIDEIVDALRTDLADHPSMARSEGNIEISIISSDVERWQALLRRGLSFYRVFFRFDSELEILAVEPRG